MFLFYILILFYSYIINSLIFHLKINIMNYFSKSCVSSRGLEYTVYLVLYNLPVSLISFMWLEKPKCFKDFTQWEMLKNGEPSISSPLS